MGWGRGDMGAGDPENRGRKGYGRREKKGREAGSVQPPKWSRPRNDPQLWNDPQIDPEMIPTPKWSPFLFTSTPKWSPINSWNGTCISSRNYYKSVAAFTFLNRVEHFATNWKRDSQEQYFSFFPSHETPRAPQPNPQSSLIPKNTYIATGYESEPRRL